jgi:aryl-phospho-beta-D-glucosidase BglC (GH1 family)
MSKLSQPRRDFLKKASTASLALSLNQTSFAIEPKKKKNKLPKWRGVNLLDFFNPEPERGRKSKTEYFKYMADWGFDFVRIPISYPSYLDFDRSKPIRPDEVMQYNNRILDEIDDLVYNCHQQKLHVSLNLHRAPGFCINAGFKEPYNLWEDQEALDAFCAHWNMWSERYKNISSKKLSFDLVNEPFKRLDPNDQHSPGGPVPIDEYRKVAEAALKTIKGVNKKRMVIADGNGGGGTAIPEFADLDLNQSCRGYFPMHISHHKASWVYKDPDSLPDPNWPGMNNERYYSKEDLEKHYAPWIALLEQGVGVHCGELGCYNQTPHEVFLSWFGDILDILDSNGIGFGLWEFSGTFGILNSGREDVAYEDWYGEKLDRKLLNLLMKHA